MTRLSSGLPVLGWLPRNANLEIPERHLGLVPTVEPGSHSIHGTSWRAFIEAAATSVTRYLDLAQLEAIARSAPRLGASEPMAKLVGSQRLVIDQPPTIAVARDEAFSFTYEDNLDLLRAAGAEIVFFSPLHDTALPSSTECIVLSGGFPEMYAVQLSANDGMRRMVRPGTI